MLSAGAVVTIAADSRSGREYHVTGQAYGGGWWAFPVDGGEVDRALRRLSNSPRAAWVKESEVDVVSAPGTGSGALLLPEVVREREG